jgi:alkanesulfonate monooxygenase SsuD/methylene tetrahydromethanopterin reductase-like flavin-dependent oxidoreductase (luciferase family)
MRIGITLPIFAADARKVLEVAGEAEQRGIDGVFVFDHLWPIGQPERPALSLYPMLGVVAAATAKVTIGSLVARVGLLPPEVVLASLESVAKIAPGRLVAALGTGDKESEPENQRLGIPVLGPADRRRDLGHVANELRQAGVECWIGAGAKATNELARELGIALNFWDVPADRVRAETEAGVAVTWAGPLPKQPAEAGERLRALAEAGAGWVVWGWPANLDLVQQACDAAGMARSGAAGAR